MNSAYVAFWASMSGGIGLNGAFMASIMSIIFAMIFAVWAMGAINSLQKSDDRSSLVPLFILGLILETIMQMFDWFPLIIMIILYFGYLYHMHGQSGAGGTSA